MASIIKANELQDFGGNSIITSDGAGTITLSSGMNTAVAAGTNNTPAFEAYLSSDQSLSDGVTAKVQFNTEVLDTDNNYDNSTNYRFTPTTAGKYYVSSGLKIEAGSDVIKNATIFIYKNGSSYKRSVFFTSTHQPDAYPIYVDAIIDMNGSSDYLEIFIYVDVSSGTPRCDADIKACHFKAYKIIGA